jgi:hypothetical protein
LLNQVPQNSHTFVKRLLQSGHLVGEGLHLSLQLDDFLTDTIGRIHAGEDQGGNGQPCQLLSNSHSD